MSHYEEEKHLQQQLAQILRDNINEWAVDDGVPQVLPKHPPAEIEGVEYPRAAIDARATNTIDMAVELDIVFLEVLTTVTVYAVDNGDTDQLIQDVRKAVNQNWEEYFDDWALTRVGRTGVRIADEAETGETRYSRLINLEFEIAIDHTN